MQLVFPRSHSSVIFLQCIFILAIVSYYFGVIDFNPSSNECINVPLHGNIKFCGNKAYRTGFEQVLKFPIDNNANITINGNFVEFKSFSANTVMRVLKYKKNIDVLDQKQIQHYLLNQGATNVEPAYPWYIKTHKYAVK